MKNLLIVATSALCVLFAVAVPLPEQDVQIVEIPLEGNKELDILSLPENNEGQLTERNKRTIGVLRQLFPELSKKVEQVIEEKIQLILPIIFRNVGPLLLRGGLGGLSGGGTTNSGGDDDDFDNDDDDDDNTNVSSNDGSTSTREGAGGRRVSISLPTFPPDVDEDEESVTQATINAVNNDEDNLVQTKETIGTTAIPKSTDTTQVSITQKPIVTTIPIQSSKTSTVTTIITEPTTIELDTMQPPSFTSTTPPLIRISTETTKPFTDNDNNDDRRTMIPSSSLMSTLSADEMTENVYGTSETTTELTTIQMQNIDENVIGETANNRMSTDDGILTFQESNTDNDYTDETTIRTKNTDFLGIIDIRSLEHFELTTQDLANVETTTTMNSLENNVDEVVDSSNNQINISARSQSIPSTMYLPVLPNLVRRRKSVVIKRQHIH